MPLLGLAHAATANGTRAASAKACSKHPGMKKCHSGGGGASGGGTGGPTPPEITVTASPNPVVETNGDVFVVLEVETSPTFSNALVDIGSVQLDGSCGGPVMYENSQVGAG